MAHTANYTMIQNLYSAYERADLEAFYADLSPSISWTESAGFPTPGTFHNAKDITENVFAVLQKEWEDWKFELEGLIDGSEGCVVCGGEV